MNEVIFKSILIADTQNHTAKFQTFSKGFNVITSTDNHVGKSSLLKSLYYSLGAEVEYDPVWDKNSKLYIVNIEANHKEYTIARFVKRFAVFCDKELTLLTESVTKELAPFLKEIFNFAVYLPNKKTEKVEIAPPAFTFMPYYIDQDKGWNGLYDSFYSIDQYKKPDRRKSLYYHLNIFTKGTVELMAKKDHLKERLEFLQSEEERLQTILMALKSETEDLPPADSVEELESHLAIPKKRIEDLITQIGIVRNVVQELETMLQQHQYNLDIIKKHSTKETGKDINIDTHITCPQCGYILDEELIDIVHSHYSAINEDYFSQQIQLIIESINPKLATAKEKYVELMTQLEQEENVFAPEKEKFDIYIRQRGLSESVRKFNRQLHEIKAECDGISNEIKEINAQINDLPSKKEVEEKYIEFVRINIMSLGAWDPAYDGNIKLLKPIKAQGTLENKIILAQFVGLFQTMDYFKSTATRFPFIVDSPRAKEASTSSSKEIIKIISNLTMLPQVILATIDYEQYSSEVTIPTEVITLTEKRKLLCNEDYSSNESRISSIYSLLTST